MQKSAKVSNGFLTQYFYNVLAVFDEFLNVVIFFGSKNETVSGRLGRAYASNCPKWFAWFGFHLVNILFFWQYKNRFDNHCMKAYDPSDNTDDELWSWSKK